MKPVYLPQGHNDFLWAAAGSPWGLLALWLIAINLVTFFVFGIDKWKAKRKETRESTRRVPEKTLFLLSALGGSVGALRECGSGATKPCTGLSASAFPPFWPSRSFFLWGCGCTSP